MSSQPSVDCLLEIDANTFQNAVLRFINSLYLHESLINELNVFPVPDGDTGTNSLLTFAGLTRTTQWPVHSLHSAANFVALSAADQARGNSGVILSEYFRGIAQTVGRSATSAQWMSALQRAAIMSRDCVAQPREGTMLTVAHEVAHVEANNQLSKYLEQVSECARNAVQQSTDLLPELQVAGVVDAGALVLSLFHDAMFEQVSGIEMPALTIATPPCTPDEVAYSGPAYEVMFLIDPFNSTIQDVRDYVSGMGDSVVIAGSANPFHVHVHTDQPSEVINHVASLGRAYRVSVNDLLGKRIGDNPNHTLRDETRAVVICQGRLMAEFLAEQGFIPVEVMPRSKPSTRDIREAIIQAGAQRVIVLPSDLDSLPTAELASREMRAIGLEVEVIPSESIVQSLAVVSVLDPDATVEEQSKYLLQVVQAVAYGAVTVAERDALTPAGPCTRGDILGLVHGRVVSVFPSEKSDDAGHRVIQEMLKHNPFAEVITIVIGANGDQHFCDVVKATYPDIDVMMISGGQLFWPYTIGVE